MKRRTLLPGIGSGLALLSARGTFGEPWWMRARRTASAPAAKPNAASASATGAAGSLARTVQGVMRPWLDQQLPPGAIAVVCREGATHFYSFGMANVASRVPVSPESIFELASITKVFTTTSLAMEVDAGRMRLDDSVAKYMPYLREHGGDIRDVTLQELATHTSSLPRTPGRPPHGHWDKRTVVEWLANWRAPHLPGTRSLYSNLALGVLGYAIANREEQPLIDVWRNQFLEPLGMHHTFFEVPRNASHLLVQGYARQGGQPVPHDPPGGWPAGGRLSSSGRDMAAFLQANLGQREDLPAVTKAMQLAQKPFFKVSEKMTQGLCWQRVHLQGNLVIDKNGGLDGTSTYIGMMPEKQLGVVVMANRGKCQATDIGRKLLLALVGLEHTEAEADKDEQGD